MGGEDWHGHIKWVLERRGTSLSQIARDLSVSPSTVTRVSKGLVRSRRVERSHSGSGSLYACPALARALSATSGRR
ncbi:MarR family transcriptional regulator [Sphingomonas aerolata]|uniref:MarR family transcriptional regulator n=1 Tax=Sphingomonas aerolata TaxID=185951 RepID=UPI003A5C0193